MGTDPKTEWMLENSEGRWLHDAEHGSFTSDPNLGLKWPNRVAADAYRLSLRGPLWALKVTEHMWIDHVHARAGIHSGGTIIPADEAIAYGLKAVRCGGLDWGDLEDDISDAISDSMDMDWSSRDGAKAVVALLMKIGGRQ